MPENKLVAKQVGCLWHLGTDCSMYTLCFRRNGKCLLIFFTNVYISMSQGMPSIFFSSFWLCFGRHIQACKFMHAYFSFDLSRWQIFSHVVHFRLLDFWLLSQFWQRWLTVIETVKLRTVFSSDVFKEPVFAFFVLAWWISSRVTQMSWNHLL